ncbi:MAG: lysophospholipid acyltransferase family protein [Deltaproteobacteria bacterium]|nr:lysophospholipid acyltransferase family protein [Candidatus Anaeroferrophillacea bacterium]
MPSIRPCPFHKRLRDYLFYALIRGLVSGVRILPRSPAIAVLRFLGGLVFAVGGEERCKTIRHLTHALGKEKSSAEIEAIARGVFRHFAAAGVDFVRMDAYVADGFRGLVSCTGFEHLETAVAGGRGVIALTAHFGNWELLGAYVSFRGVPLRVVGTPLKHRRLDDLLVAARNRAGYGNIARGRDTREIIRALHRGDVLGMLIDQDTRVNGVFADFFGHPAHTPAGPLLLARKYDVPVVPMFMWLRDDLTYQFECLPPLDLVHSDDQDHDLRVNVRKCNEMYESMIRRHPEQWVWMHKRWKKRPPPEGDGAERGKTAASRSRRSSRSRRAA